MTHLEDSRIIDLFFARSEQAIEELDRKHGAAVRKTAANILADRRDVEECANDTYLGCWNEMPPQRPDPLISFVCRIARNLAVDYETKELVSAVNRFLSGLDYDDRFLFVRRYWFADSVKDIADAMHSRENRVSVRLFRLRGKLRNILKKEGFSV